MALILFVSWLTPLIDILYCLLASTQASIYYFLLSLHPDNMVMDDTMPKGRKIDYLQLTKRLYNLPLQLRE
jgi:hypothetical protein